MLPDPIASVLRSGREQYNARFALARRRWPELDADHFGDFLTNTVTPLVSLTEQARPGTVVAVTEAAYDVALELIGQRLAGRDARSPVINELWTQTFPALAPHLAAAPARLLPALTNAAHQLTATPGGGVTYWVTLLRELAPRAVSADELLRLGQVLAWRAGLAHFRLSALAVADALPEPLALAAVGATPGAAWADMRARLASDPWFDPQKNGSTPPPLPRPHVIRLAGAFRGYGGLFMEPPRVATNNGHLLVRAGEDAWLLTADIFGATFHRATPTEAAAFASDAAVTLPKDIRSDDRVIALGEITSMAQCGQTLALTGTLTHQVVLVAL